MSQGGNELVSIIIATYNHAKFIEQTIDSVLSQSYYNFELIIVDDGSTDNTNQVVGKYEDSRIKYILIDHSGRPATPRNEGISISKGKYIAFLDSDDLWMPDFLEKSLQYFNIDKNIGVVTSKLYFINSNSDITYNTFHDSIADNEIFGFDKLFFQNVVNLSAAIVRRECLEKTGNFNESNKFRGVEDYHLWLRISSEYKIYFLSQVLGYYRKHEEGISTNINQQLANKYNTLIDISKNFPHLIKPINRSAYKQIKTIQIRLLKNYIKKYYLIKALKWGLLILKS